MKTYYDLLEVAPDAPAEEIRHAFRRTIARYHPDKVQHLGAEFQELAQARAAELTSAYKTLTDAARRVEYDASLAAERPEPVHVRPSEPPAARVPETARAPVIEADRTAASFEALRSRRDETLKRAALARLDRLLADSFVIADRPVTADFDLSCVPRPRRLERWRSRPWLLAKFVSRLDADVVSEVWAQAVRANASHKAEVFVFVLASDLASRQELAAAIEINRDLADPGRRITIVPVDLRDWQALVPKDADPAVKAFAARLSAAC